MLVSRQPLQTLPMSSSQRQPRTVHSRLHDKDDAPLHHSRFNSSTDLRPPTASRDSKRPSLSRTVNEKKRKMGTMFFTATKYSVLRLTYFAQIMTRMMTVSCSRVSRKTNQKVPRCRNRQHPPSPLPPSRKTLTVMHPNPGLRRRMSRNQPPRKEGRDYLFQRPTQRTMLRPEDQSAFRENTTQAIAAPYRCPSNHSHQNPKNHHPAKARESRQPRLWMRRNRRLSPSK